MQLVVRDTLPMATTKSWRMIGGAFDNVLVARHCWKWRRIGVFGLRKMKEAENAIADGSLVSLLCR